MREGQTTLDDLAAKALKKIKKTLMRRKGAAPRLYRNPDEPYFQEIRWIAWEIVCEWFAERGCPIPRDTLINLVFRRIKGLRLRGEWDFPMPRYDTVRRRVNELLEEEYVGSPVPCIAIEAEILGKKTTVYLPNPEKVAPEKRGEVLGVIRDWENARKRRRA